MNTIRLNTLDIFNISKPQHFEHVTPNNTKTQIKSDENNQAISIYFWFEAERCLSEKSCGIEAFLPLVIRNL